MEIRAAVRDEAQIRGRDNAELKELVLQLLHNRQHMRDLQVMEQEGIPIAERLMEEAQEVRVSILYIVPFRVSTLTGGDQELYHHPRDSQKYLEYQRGLLNLHQATGVPPAMPDLSREVTRLGNSPVIGGSFSRGTCHPRYDTSENRHIQRCLARKLARPEESRLERSKECPGLQLSRESWFLFHSPSCILPIMFSQRFNQEIRVWSRLKHDNILPLLGFVSNLGPHIHTVRRLLVTHTRG